MASNKKSSFLGNLLGRNDNSETEEIQADQELLTCLHNLSSIGEGRTNKVDREIKKFKKLVKIGSTAIDLQNQVTVIIKVLTAIDSEEINKQQIKQFHQLPAEILLNEFIEQPLSDDIKNRLENYRNSLSSTALAPETISDLIELLEPSIDITTSEQTVEMQSDVRLTAELDHAKLNEIAKPLLDLFSQINLSDTQGEELQQMKHRSTKMHELNELCIFIDDVCHLILSFISSSAGRFENFLGQLKSRLDTVNTCIIQNSETNQAISNCSDSFSQCVSTQINHIQTSLAEPTDLASLELVISSSLENIVEGVTSFDSERKSLEEDSIKRIEELQNELVQARSEADNLKENLQQQQERALTDQLTKLPNRHAYNERLHMEYNRWRRYNQPLSLAMGDIDLFKHVNDTHGHIAGDTALIATAQVLQKGIRTSDFVARYGGEEFIILLPETKLTQAIKAMNQLRREVKALQITAESGAEINLTMSFGVASFEEGDTFSSVLSRADKALYRAKAKGRNQVCVQKKTDTQS